jgi:hypothetical protein
MRSLAATVLVIVVAGGACGGPSTTPAAATPTTASTKTKSKAADDPSCPVLVPGTSASAEDTPDGGALVFVTTGDVAAVRARAHALTTMHNGRQNPDAHPGASDQMGAMIEIPSIATATDIPGGARIVWVTLDTGDVAKLQAALHVHAKQLASGDCRMAM